MYTAPVLEKKTTEAGKLSNVTKWITYGWRVCPSTKDYGLVVKSESKNGY